MLYAIHALTSASMRLIAMKFLTEKNQSCPSFTQLLQCKYEIKALINVEMQGPQTHPSALKRRDSVQKGVVHNNQSPCPTWWILDLGLVSYKHMQIFYSGRGLLSRAHDECKVTKHDISSWHALSSQQFFICSHSVTAELQQCMQFF